MIEVQDFLPAATDGELFTINLQSSLAHQWFLFQHYPERSGVLETIYDGESSMAQFFGDYTALDRLEGLANTLLLSKPEEASSHMFAARVNAARHHFMQANENLMTNSWGLLVAICPIKFCAPCNSRSFGRT